MQRLLLPFVLFFSLFDLSAKEILPPKIKAEKSFAIVIDAATYHACKTNILKYQDILAKEQLAAYILVNEWNNPDEVKAELLDLYQNHSLEGALFVGQIPIPMIRDAHHLTSAFKMNQTIDRRDSSVPSDRFYDDFDLTFDYLGQDNPDELFHYYSLRYDSPQYIECDIYSGRIKPTKEGAQGYAQINHYFEKLLQERAKENPLDVVVSYSGEGSSSNSLTAWKEELITLREQLPQAFTNANSAKFLSFYMSDYMKEMVVQEMQRPDVDMMLFHTHGMPYRQYLTGEPLTSSDQYKEAVMRYFRAQLRRSQSRNQNTDSLIHIWKTQYHLNDSWFTGALSHEMHVADSLEDLQKGIVLEDLPVIAPNPRFVLFDACYNADFREDSYIAGEYIFSAGKNLICFGSSVNSLQDKSSNDLLGMLGYGYRIGHWAQMVNCLETHIVGDPTIRFAPSTTAGMELPDFGSGTIDSWRRVLQTKSNPIDLRGLALYKLFRLRAPGLSNIMMNLYDESDSYMLRLYAFQFLQHYNDGNFEKLLKKAINDPYEFIRRRTVTVMGRSGNPDYISDLVKTYLRDNDFDERVGFNCRMSLSLFNQDDIRKEAMRQIAESNLFDKELEMKKFEERILPQSSIRDDSYNLADTTQKMSSRRWGVQVLRNNNYGAPLDTYFDILKNPQDDLTIRISLAEALGWYIYSQRRGEIVETCREVANNHTTDPLLKKELLKTVSRLESYLRDDRFYSRFGIVIDSATYQTAGAEVDAYKAQLESEGLGAFILAGNWANPMELREELIAQTKCTPTLEGVVFIGEIPIARVQNAQHLTTAFKMNEQKFPIEESSVPTDRFYDNPHLQWEYIAQDSAHHLVFYYRLKDDSPQHLDAAFYSARIMPPTDRGEDPVASIQKFLRKVVRKHQEPNPFDKFVVFNGYFYNSDCLTAWNNEQLALKEQFPECFQTSQGNGFYNFRQGVFPKYKLFNKMQEEGIDLFLFHEHGSYNIQHISDDYPAISVLDKRETFSTYVRNTYRTHLTRNPQRAEAFKKQCIEDNDYGFLELMFSDSVLTATKVADSIMQAGRNIVLEDLAKIKPQALFTIFDACYNGSYYEAKNGYVAGYHLFGEGETICTQGNTVNVYQDKWSIELIGMLAQGARVGFWHKEVETLECHLNGDPTYFFHAPNAAQFNRDLAVHSGNEVHTGSNDVWKTYFLSDNPVYQAIALKKMGQMAQGSGCSVQGPGSHVQNYSDLLLETFRNSPYYSVRMEALKRLLDVKDENMTTALALALDDPYELIRRNAARYAGYSGDERLIAPLQSIMEHNMESVRVQFVAESALSLFDDDRNGKIMATIANKEAQDDERIGQIRSLRNYNRHPIVPELIKVLKDVSDKDEIRVPLAEALGWFAWSITKPAMIQALEEVKNAPSSSIALKEECTQSIIRLMPRK